MPPPAPPSISAAALRSLPDMPMLADHTFLADAPRIVAAAEDRAYLSRGDLIQAAGELHGVSEFQVLRRGRQLIDPHSQEHLGDELLQVGKARLLSSASSRRHSLLIVDARQEIQIGDQLAAWLPQAAPAITPYWPSTAIDAVIIAVSAGDARGYAAQDQMVAINKGRRDAISTGMQLSLHGAAQASVFPAQAGGRLLILRVFERVSYGVIAQARAPVQVGDRALAPRPEHRDVE